LSSSSVRSALASDVPSPSRSSLATSLRCFATRLSPEATRASACSKCCSNTSRSIGPAATLSWETGWSSSRLRDVFVVTLDKHQRQLRQRRHRFVSIGSPKCTPHRSHCDPIHGQPWEARAIRSARQTLALGRVGIGFLQGLQIFFELGQQIAYRLDHCL